MSIFNNKDLNSKFISMTKSPVTPNTAFDALTVSSQTQSNGQNHHVCCLIESSRSCSRPASNASYSKKIQGTVAQRKLKLEVDPKSSHMYICEHHKTMIQNLRAKRKRRESEESSETNTSTSNGRDLIDLFQLQMNTLRRYKKHFKVTSRPGLNKAQLAEFLTRHLKTIPVVEKEALTYFIYMVKTKKSRLENTELEQEQKD